MTTPKEIGKVFREARSKRGMSLEDVSDNTRIHMKVLTDIENGVLDRLGKLYMKSFLKKYSSFLGLDESDILRKFDSVTGGMPTRDFSMTPEGAEEKEPSFTFTFSKEKAQKALAVAAACAALFLLFTVFGMIRSKMAQVGQRRREAAASRVQETGTPAVARVETRAPAQPRAEETPSPRKGFMGLANFAATSPKEGGEVVLTLKARGEVWIKVTREGDTLFAGIMERGNSETWKARGVLNVWTGKAEMLDFRVNTYEIGKIASGVVKNIQVSDEGIRIGDNWVTRFD
jgi:cytoskeletal protein RodZ